MNGDLLASSTRTLNEMIAGGVIIQKAKKENDKQEDGDEPVMTPIITTVL